MIFRNNIHQTYNNQFQTGTHKLNTQKLEAVVQTCPVKKVFLGVLQAGLQLY